MALDLQWPTQGQPSRAENLLEYLSRTNSPPFRQSFSSDHTKLQAVSCSSIYSRTISEESSTIRTLHAYLEASWHVLKVILQIPPVDPSTSLRTAYLLRLTGDVLKSITGYQLSPPTNGPARQADGPIASTANLDSIPPPLARSVLYDLLDFLDDPTRLGLLYYKDKFGIQVQGRVSISWYPSTPRQDYAPQSNRRYAAAQLVDRWTVRA